MTYLNALRVSLDNAGLTDTARNQNNCLKNNTSNHCGYAQPHIHTYKRDTHTNTSMQTNADMQAHSQTHILLRARHYKALAVLCLLVELSLSVMEV